MMRKLFVLVLLALASIASAEELYRIDYSANAEPPENGFTVRHYYLPSGYSFMPSTDGSVPGSPLLIRSPSVWSWIYAAGDVPAEKLGDAESIKLTAYLMSNRPQNVNIIVTEGASFDGGHASYLKSVTSTMGGDGFTWQKVEVDFQRTKKDSMVSFAVGTGGSKDLWVAIDRLVVTTGTAAADEAPKYEITLHVKVVYQIFCKIII